ncbi:MAG: copper resistance protein CopC [Marmoricola sp.]
MDLLDGNNRARTVQRRAPLALTALAALAVVVLLAGFVWLLPEPPTALRSADPDLSAHVGRAPDQVRLGFGQPGVPGSITTRVTVLSPDDEDLARGPALPSPDGIHQPIAPLRERGAYQVAYEVQLLDGDVARGQYWFWYAPSASGSTTRLESPALLGLLIALAAALAAGLLTPGRRAQPPVSVPAQRTGSPSPGPRPHPVPVQRSRERHDGLSSPGTSPRARPTPGAPPAEPTPAEPTQPVPPRNV